MDDSPLNSSNKNPDVLELDSDQAEISSACMSCGGTGVTRMLLTKIPHFNDIVVMSFECKECPYKNNEVQNISSLRDYGVRFQVKVNDSRGLDNQVVISNTSTIKLVDIDFEIPRIESKGVITTVEGLIMDVITNLDEHIRSICEEFTRNEGLQIELSTGNLKSAKDYIYQLTEIKEKLLQYSQGLESFRMEIDDPSGNSYIEDNGCLEIETHKYTRTNQHLKEMGYMYNQDELDNEEQQQQELNTEPNDTNRVKTNEEGKENGAFQKDRDEWDLNKSLDEEDVGKENLRLIVDCPNCGKQGYNEICQVLVPGFGNCIIMSFICEFCGSKTNEMKPGGGYKPYGKRWKLRVEDDRDLNRDVIISETATVKIEEMDFEMTPGTIGSVFTSVEGVIKKIVESLETSYPFLIGDSVSDTNNEIRQRISNLNSLTSTYNFNLVLDDPIDHSFISSSLIDSQYDKKLENGGSTEPPKDEPLDTNIEVDGNLSYLLYERSYEQNDELGFNDMNTENY